MLARHGGLFGTWASRPSSALAAFGNCRRPNNAVLPSRHWRRASTVSKGPRLSPKKFYDLLHDRGLQFYTGVPDSLLKDFCAYVQDHSDKDKHIICANEGASIGVAAGYHLGTYQIPVVYMQNSGLGNAINPLVSLCDPKVYSLPMLLLIGWRGEPGLSDEIQHQVQGRITPDILSNMGIPFEVLPSNLEAAHKVVDTAVSTIKSRSGPYALLVKQKCFAKYQLEHDQDHDDCLLTREAVLDILLPKISNSDAVIATTGFTSRELFEYRQRRNQLGEFNHFYMVGSMGHATALSLGVALAQPSRPVWCLDGDGAALMHLGSMATIAVQSPNNMKHIIFNNAAHESVGGQPTGGFQLEFADIAKALGYDLAIAATNPREIANAVNRLHDHKTGPAFLEIRICKGTRPDLGRPTISPRQIKAAFMKTFASDDGL